jgi:hypothetical protein
VPRVIAKTSDDIDACGLTLDELQELWLGPGPRGSLFHSREELQDAWIQGRDVVMRHGVRMAKDPKAGGSLRRPSSV